MRLLRVIRDLPWLAAGLFIIMGFNFIISSSVLLVTIIGMVGFFFGCWIFSKLNKRIKDSDGSFAILYIPLTLAILYIFKDPTNVLWYWYVDNWKHLYMIRLVGGMFLGGYATQGFNLK